MSHIARDECEVGAARTPTIWRQNSRVKWYQTTLTIASTTGICVLNVRVRITFSCHHSTGKQWHQTLKAPLSHPSPPTRFPPSPPNQFPPSPSQPTRTPGRGCSQEGRTWRRTCLSCRPFDSVSWTTPPSSSPPPPEPTCPPPQSSSRLRQWQGCLLL